MHITTMLTEQDVRDAHMALQTRRLAQAEMCTPESLLRDLETYDGQAKEQIAQYQRDRVLLRDYIVLSSDRSTAGGRFDATAEARIVSPIVQVESGHIGTMTAYHAVALAQR